MICQELKYKKYLKYNLSIKNYILKKLIILPHNFYIKTIGFIKKINYYILELDKTNKTMKI